MPPARRGLLMCFALSAGLTALVGRDVLGGDRTFVPTDLLTSRPPWAPPESDDSRVQNRLHLDVVEFFAMNAVEARRDLEAGRWPLWNPAVLGGFPVFTDPQVGTFYPPRAVLVALFEPARSIDLFILLHLFFIGPAMFVFLRHRGLSEGAALFGALGWMLGGQSLIWFKYGCGLVAAVFLPLLALALDRAFDGRSPRWAAGAGALWAAMFAGSHPQLSFYALVWAGLRTVSAWRSIGPKPTVRLALLFGGAGMAVAAVQLLPFLDLLANSQKGIVASTSFSRPGRAPGALLLLLWPRAFGSPLDRLDVTTPWLGENFFEITGYLGLLPLALAPLAGRRAALYWAAAGLNLALATIAPLWWILRELPGLQAMVPHRLFLFGFAGIVLGAMGLDSALRDGLPRRLLGLAAAGAGAVVLAGLAGWMRGATWVSLANPPYAALALAAVTATAALVVLAGRLAPEWRAAACGAALAVDLLPFFLAYNASHAPMPPPAPAVAALPRDARILVDTPSAYWKATFRNYASLSGHETPSGHASQYPRIYTEMTRALGAQPSALRANHARALRALNVGWVLTPEGARAVDALPRAWLVGRAEVLPEKAGRLARLADPGLDLGTTALVEEPVNLAEGEPPSGTVERISAFEYRVRTSKTALLVVSETWDAGWK
ncbi:MAG TPA: hypothetical protein VEJ18_15605, partial [Planctomycetota bacterium]|nr:hypothetical protein [Planctomycetota bacterium]